MSFTQTLLTFVLVIANFLATGQYISNGNFEDGVECPVSIQFDDLSSWFPLVGTPDIHMCGVAPASCALDGNAASGTAYVGFGAMGGNAAEGVAQALLTPLIAGEEYTISFAAKNCAEGLLASNCYGLCVYGIAGNEFMDSFESHASHFEGAIELACTPALTNVDWEYFSFTFVPQENLDHLMFTTGQGDDCIQMMYLDDIQLIQSFEEEEEEEEAVEEETPLESSIFVPNAFTPNLDGTNESFRPVLSFEPEEYFFQVVNRWGETIFSTSDPHEPWIGNVYGGSHFAEAGVYTYLLTVKGGEYLVPRLLKGHITLVR